MVGASAAACAQNLKSSSFTGTFSSGWTFASTGVTPNGTSAYLNTNLIPFTNLTIANFHLSYYSRTNNNPSIDFDMGCGDSGGGYSSSMFLRRSNNQAAFDSSNATNVRITATSQSDSTGFYVGSITSTSKRLLIKNGSTTLASSTATNASLLLDSALLIAAYNARPIGVVGLSPETYGSKQCALSSIGDGLNATQIGNFYTSVQAFQTTLSRNV